LNQTIALIGTTHEINMAIEPFNNIVYWLRTYNGIGKRPQILCVTMYDLNRDQHLFKFKFNASGLFEHDPQYSTVLPLVIGG
jgi:hypothetical protein